MDTSLSHVALLVASVENSAKVLNARGIQTGPPETFESEGTKEIYVGSYDSQRALLLLLEGVAEGPYQRAMMKRGPSLHHIAIDVLNVEMFAVEAQRIGWAVHPVSEQTISHKTLWLFRKGVPTLIEVHQKKELSSKPFKVSKVELPLQKEHLGLFEGIGLGSVVVKADEIKLTVDGQLLSFRQIVKNR